MYFYLGSLFEIAFDLAKENEQKKGLNDSIRAAGSYGRKLSSWVGTGAKGKTPVPIPVASKTDMSSVIPIMGPLVIRPKPVKNIGTDVEGPTPGDDSDVPESLIVSLSDVPIALSHFLEWYNKRIISKNLRSYSLRKFISDAIKTLVQPALSHGDLPQRKTSPFGRVSIKYITSAAAEGGETRVKSSGRATVSSIKKVKFIDPEDPTSGGLNQVLFQHQVIYVDDSNPGYVHGIGYDEKKDSQKGVYHLALGRDHGLVKNIKFSKANIKFFVESQIQSQSDQDLKFVQEKYNASVSMYGNVIFRPGMTVFIDPRLPMMGSVADPGSPVSTLGLGGLYSVLDCTYIFTENSFETELNTLYLAPIRRKPTEPRPVNQEADVAAYSAAMNLSEGERSSALEALSTKNGRRGVLLKNNDYVKIGILPSVTNLPSLDEE